MSDISAVGRSKLRELYVPMELTSCRKGVHDRDRQPMDHPAKVQQDHVAVETQEEPHVRQYAQHELIVAVAAKTVQRGVQ